MGHGLHIGMDVDPKIQVVMDKALTVLSNFKLSSGCELEARNCTNLHVVNEQNRPPTWFFFRCGEFPGFSWGILQMFFP